MNNDGLIDLFVAKGNVEDAGRLRDARSRATCSSARRTARSSRGAGRPGSSSFARARGAALADLNLDGMLDLVEVDRRENVRLWRNVGSGTADDAASRWATGWRCSSSRLAPNRDAIGAWVEVTRRRPRRCSAK